MPTLGSEAHDKDGNRVFDTKVPKVPEDPRDDMTAAGKALWRLMLAKATVGVPEDKRWEEVQYDGCKGVVWEGKRLDIIRELWPKLEHRVYRDLGTQFQRYTRGNLLSLYNGRGMPSMWWIAYEWVDRDIDWTKPSERGKGQKTATARPTTAGAGGPTPTAQPTTVTPTPRDMPAQKPQLVLKEAVSMSATGAEPPLPRDLAGFLAGMQSVVERDQLREEKKDRLLEEIGNAIEVMHRIREFVEGF